MKNSLGKVWGLILAWIFVILLFVFIIQARDYYGPNPIVRKRVNTIEAFQGGAKKMIDVEDINMNGMSPANDTSVSKPRDPYALLGSWLPLAKDPMYKTAQGCHAVDFQTRLEKTGNFRQLTNNYKRGDPDSCSGAIQDLTFAIYKTTPIPNEGCIQPFVEN
jgi:hypothetical protein